MIEILHPSVKASTNLPRDFAVLVATPRQTRDFPTQEHPLNRYAVERVTNYTRKGVPRFRGRQPLPAPNHTARDNNNSRECLQRGTCCRVAVSISLAIIQVAFLYPWPVGVAHLHSIGPTRHGHRQEESNMANCSVCSLCS